MSQLDFRGSHYPCVPPANAVFVDIVVTHQDLVTDSGPRAGAAYLTEMLEHWTCRAVKLGIGCEKAIETCRVMGVDAIDIRMFMSWARCRIQDLSLDLH